MRSPNGWCTSGYYVSCLLFCICAVSVGLAFDEKGQVSVNYIALVKASDHGKLAQLNPLDFDASVEGSFPLRVTRVSPAALSDTLQILIVLDLASVSPDSASCLIRQMGLASREFRGDKRIRLFTVSGWQVPGVVEYRVHWARENFTFFALSPDRVPPDENSACLDQSSGRRWRSSASERYASLVDLRGLIQSLDSRSEGPFCLLWVGQSFRWFEVQRAFTSEDEQRASAFGQLQNAVIPNLELISRLGVSVFPVLLHRGHESRDEIAEAKVAGKLAAFTGGQVMVDHGGLRRSLLGAVEKVKNGFVIRVEGPPVPRKREMLGRWLHIRWKPDGRALSLTRSFATANRKEDESWLTKLGTPPPRLLAEANVVPMSGGCPSSSSEESSSVARFAIPRWVAELSGFRLHLQQGSAGRNQEKYFVFDQQIAALPDSTPEAVRFCAELPHDPWKKEAWVILFSEAAGWAGLAEAQ